MCQALIISLFAGLLELCQDQNSLDQAYNTSTVRPKFSVVEAHMPQKHICSPTLWQAILHNVPAQQGTIYEVAQLGTFAKILATLHSRQQQQFYFQFVLTIFIFFVSFRIAESAMFTQHDTTMVIIIYLFDRIKCQHNKKYLT